MVTTARPNGGAARPPADPALKEVEEPARRVGVGTRLEVASRAPGSVLAGVMKPVPRTADLDPTTEGLGVTAEPQRKLELRLTVESVERSEGPESAE